MVTSLSIRVATEVDADPLQDLYLHLSPDNKKFPDHVARERVRALARYDGSAILLGEINGALVSSCTLVIMPNLTRGGVPYALIENVVTHGEYRRRGFGKAMLHAASERAWQYGCYKVMLLTGSSQASTLAFYENAGFGQSKTGFQKRRCPERSDA